MPNSSLRRPPRRFFSDLAVVTPHLFTVGNAAADSKPAAVHPCPSWTPGRICSAALRRAPDIPLQDRLFALWVEEPYLARVDHQAHRLALFPYTTLHWC